MKIGFIDPFPHQVTNSWVQTTDNLRRGLEQHADQLLFVNDVKLVPSIGQRTRKVLHRIRGERYLFERQPKVLQQMAKTLEERFERSCPDVIFSPSTLPIAYLKTDRPIVFWTDSTFAGMVGLYQSFSDLTPSSKRAGHLVDRLAIRNSAHCIFSSHWAKDVAIQEYGADAQQVSVIPFGANLLSFPENRSIPSLIDQRSQDVLKLVFIGFDWKRKGGEQALEVMRSIRSKGLACELHVMGPKPNILKPEDGLVMHGRLNRSNEEDRDRFHKILAASHLLILPTKADCSPIVFSEASAYGVPSISTRVGGQLSVLFENRNGLLFDLDAPNSAMETKILELWNDKATYRRLALSTRDVFDQELNWDSNINKLHQILKRTIDAQERGI